MEEVLVALGMSAVLVVLEAVLDGITLVVDTIQVVQQHNQLVFQAD